MDINDINNRLNFINESYDEDDNLVLTRDTFSDEIWKILISNAHTDEDSLYYYGEELGELLYDNSFMTQELSDEFAAELGMDKTSNLLDNMYFKVILKE